MARLIDRLQKFDESQHPRNHGKFAPKGTIAPGNRPPGYNDVQLQHAGREAYRRSKMATKQRTKAAYLRAAQAHDEAAIRYGSTGIAHHASEAGLHRQMAASHRTQAAELAGHSRGWTPEKGARIQEVLNADRDRVFASGGGKTLADRMNAKIARDPNFKYSQIGRAHV